MNSTRFLKKRPSRRFLFLIFIALGSISLFGQRPGLDGAPSRANARAAGFSQIFYSVQTFDRVLSGSDRVRFFNGVTAEDSRNAVLMAIGLDANGNEIGDQFLQVNVLNVPSMVDRSTKEQQVATADGHNRITAFTSEFVAQDLRDLLANPGVTGVIFSPRTNTADDGTEVLALDASAASSVRNRLRMAPLPSPCPPDCGSQ